MICVTNGSCRQGRQRCETPEACGIAPDEPARAADNVPRWIPIAL